MAGAVKRGYAKIKHSQDHDSVRIRIHLAPASMVIRELLQNGIENALLLPRQKDRQIRFRRVMYTTPFGEQVRKLAVWNRGPGMSDDKLVTVMDLACSGSEKSQSQDANYGIGAKTSGLKASPEGMRYRSCHKGRVHQVVIRQHKGDYVKEKIQIGNEWYEVVDVTDECESEGYPTDCDWTEVMLVGIGFDHDTVDDLFLEQEGTDKKWLAQTVNQRFYDLSNVEVVREADATTEVERSNRRLLGLSAVPVRQDERVRASFNSRTIEIRYGIVQERTGGGSAKARLGYTSHGCVVFRNECFDYHESLKWGRLAPRYGISHGQRQVFVHVILPDKYPAFFDQYRQNIQDSDRKRNIQLEDFQEAVYEHRPQWLIDFIASQAPDQHERSESLKDRLRELAKYLKMHRDLYKHDPEGDESISTTERREEEEVGGKEPANSVGDQDDGGTKPASAHSRRRGSFPDVEWVYGGTASQRDELSQRAASYDFQLHKIRLNEQYEPRQQAIDMLMEEFQHVRDQQELVNSATASVNDEIEFRAIKHVMLGLEHKYLERWSPGEVKDAMIPEALSIPLSDYRDIAASVRRTIGMKFGSKKSQK